MQGRKGRVLRLLETLRNNCVDEVRVRRIVSTLLLRAVQLLAAARYYEGTGGKGPKRDRFCYREFHEDLLDKGLKRRSLSVQSIIVGKEEGEGRGGRQQARDKLSPLRRVELTRAV